MAPKAVRSINQFSVFRPKREIRIDRAMINRMLYVVFEKRSERILSSAMVESTRIMARYAPMIPVRIAASAVTPMTARPTGPMIVWAA